MTNTNTGDLLKRAVGGDQAAMVELHELQKDGKALRLYPFGRKSPTEDGMSPVLFDRGENGIMPLRVARPGHRMEFMDKDIAGLIRQQISQASLAFVEFVERYGSPTQANAEMRKLMTRGLYLETSYGERGIYLDAKPHVDELFYDTRMAFTLVDAWIETIGATRKEPEEFGFVDFEEFFEITEFVCEATGFGVYES